MTRRAFRHSPKEKGAGRTLTAFTTLVSFAVSTFAPTLGRATPSAVQNAPVAATPVPGTTTPALPKAETPNEAAPEVRIPDATELDRVRRLIDRVYGNTDGEPPPKADDAPADRALATGSSRRSFAAVPPTEDTVKKAAVGAPVTMKAEDLPTASEAVVGGKTLSIPAGEATITGLGESFSAQLSTGIATYTIPFALPKARGDAQPSLELSYSSGHGSGIAGMGWTVGVASIARQTDRGSPKYDDRATFHHEQDRFVFNGGQEIVPICVVGSPDCSRLVAASASLQRPAEVTPAWANGWQYFRPRVEGAFLRFFWSPDHRTWRVQGKSGVTMELGVPLDGSGDATALEANPTPANSNEPEIYRWLLAREYDTFGDANPASGNPAPVNVVRYRYSNFGAGAAAYLTDIYDTPPAENAASASVSEYAHHVRLAYEDRSDPTFSYRSGFRIDETKRLRRVDVTSKPFIGPAAASREVVRRYHLAYDPAFHVSLLASLTVEGRCADTGGTQVTEDQSESLPESTNCPTLPPMAFGYQHVEGHLADGSTESAPLAGYEAFDERIRTVTDSPAHSLDESQTVLHDVDADALPDVLVTAAGLFGGKHGVYFNAGGGVADRFTASTIAVQGVLGATANDITLGNQNVVPLDIDGDAIVDLVHMPMARKYAVYTAVNGGAGWAWQGRVIATADSLNPKIDFGRDAAFIKVVDVDYDGLVDVVRTNGTELETFFSLGRYPNGDGRFGHATRTGVETADLSTEPVATCLPWSGTAISFGDADTFLADMNGDDLVDIVRVRRGDVRYWPGRGNGFFGTGARDDCAAGTYGQDRDLAMNQSPFFSDIQGDSLRLEDVNGDGLADLVQVRFEDVDVWLNVDGAGFTERHTLGGTPASPSFASRVRLTDIDGSGTPDILWGDANNYRYMDLAGGKRPWVLTHVENGLGKTTDLSYSTSVGEMLSARAAGKPWPHGMPIVTQVVKRVVVSDNLTVAGRPPSSDVTEYSYAEPVYDGRQREFRGFRHASSRRVGDPNSPAETMESTFLLGECADETADSVDDCGPGGRYRDNVRESLKGLPYVVERHDDSGRYLSTITTNYRLRDLYVGTDGRHARHAFATSETAKLYDVQNFAPASSSSNGDIVDLESPLDAAPAPALTAPLPQRSAVGTATTTKSFAVDAFGNTTSHVDAGCTGGTPCSEFTEESLTYESTPTLVPSPSGWLFRTSRESTKGAAHAQAYGALAHQYDANGRPTVDTASFMGTVELARTVSDSAFFPPRSGGTGSTPTSVDVQTNTYDAFGNAKRQQGANQRCRDVSYDPVYSELPVSETQFVNGCDSANPLTTKVDAYDRGLGAPILVHDFANQPTKVDYDGFGRIVRLFKPDPAGGATSALPSFKAEYILPPRTGGAFSIVHTFSQDGADPTVSSYLEQFAYVDGLGRTFVTLKEAEPASGTSVPRFIVSGLTDYDDKGSVRFRYLEQFQTGSPTAFAFAAPSAEPRKSLTYDAFGRTVSTTDYDRTPTLLNLYHALSVDHYDAEDQSAGTHQNTFFTERSDGHGRVVKSIERFKINNVQDQRQTLVRYLPTGAPETIRRVRQSTGEETNRYLVYDTRGRLVLNVEPNSSPSYSFRASPNQTATNQADYSAVSAWRYRYDDAGDMVGVSDSRGCGANFFFDGLGRLTAEDYFPCVQTQQLAYSRPTFSGSTPTGGVEVFYAYDGASTAVPLPNGFSPGFSAGRLVQVLDQGSHTLVSYDARGRKTRDVIQVARPGNTTVNFTDRYAPRFYSRTTAYDAADRETTRSTGAQTAAVLGSGAASTVTTAYNERGAVKSVTSSYGDLVTSVDRDADGFVTNVVYGDAASTTTSSEPDERRRPRTIMTFRGPPASFPPNFESLPPNTFQLLLQHQQFFYDLVSDPVRIQDFRTPEEWPAGSKPADRDMVYDDLYRVTKLTYTYRGTTGGADGWVSPFDDELDAETLNPLDPQSLIDARRDVPSPQVTFPTRILQQSFGYDWLGNTSSTDDDLHGFYDRSLGTVTNGTAASAPYQIKTATTTSGARRGSLRAEYDTAGNLTGLFVQRNGPCRPLVPGCAQAYRYEWDELGRLARARRWDFLAIDVNNPPSALLAANAELRYKYGADDDRVLKTATDGLGRQRHTAYPFDSLELRRAQYTGLGNAADYQLSTVDLTGLHVAEVPYLYGEGVRLARVTFQPDAGALLSVPSSQHVFFELSDQLGSTDVVLDKASGELVEKATYQAYGSRESDYRPERWNAFREDYGFTGKEDDVEVGLVYFGKRFLNPFLDRWCSADPAGLHDVGEADLNLYAYVRGAALKAVDPLGLQDHGQCYASDADRQAAEQRAEAAAVKEEADRRASAESGPKVDVTRPAWSFEEHSHAIATVTPFTPLLTTLYLVTHKEEAYFHTAQSAETATSFLPAAIMAAEASQFANGASPPSAGRSVTMKAEEREIRQMLGLASAEARAAQGQGKYGGVDAWSDTTLKPGQIVVQGAPGGDSKFFTTLDALNQSQGDARVFSEGLQIAKHETKGYRPGVTILIVEKETPAAAGVARANPQHGPGEFPQLYVPDTSALKPVLSVPLKKGQ